MKIDLKTTINNICPENNYILQEMEIIEKDVQAWDSIFIVIIMVISVMMLERWVK